MANYLKNQYIYDGHYVILFCYIAFANSFTYIFSTLYYDRVKKYNYIFGFLCMTVSTIIVCVLFKSQYDIMTMGLSKYLFVLFIWSIINFYVSFDTYLMVNLRGDLYSEEDYIYGYYALWCDWFSYFWLDLYHLLEDSMD